MSFNSAGQRDKLVFTPVWNRKVPRQYTVDSLENRSLLRRGYIISSCILLNGSHDSLNTLYGSHQNMQVCLWTKQHSLQFSGIFKDPYPLITI